MQIRLRGSSLGWAATLALILVAGCHSPWVQTTVVNAQDTPVSLVEVSYPGGSFGVQAIAAHANFHYRFRVLGAGNATIDFSDSMNHSHTATGPVLEPGQQGSLRIEIQPGGHVAWTPILQSRK